MYKHEEILILGDSFAYSRECPNDWPNVVIKELTQSTEIARGAGFSGCSWWSVRNKLLEELSYKVPKVLIITHTECQRVISDFDYPLNTGTVLNDDVELVEVPKEVVKAAKDYFLNLYSENFHYWSQQQWYKELDEIILKHGIEKVIHLHVFSDFFSNPFYVFQKSTTFITPLWEICDDYEAINNAAWTKLNNILVPANDTWERLNNRNHFSEENNKKLGMIIVDAIKNYSVGSKTISLN